MQEFLKLSCVTVLLFAVPGSVVVCTDNRPDPTTAVLQYALPAVSVAAFVALLWLQFRRDRVEQILKLIRRHAIHAIVDLHLDPPDFAWRIDVLC